MATLFERIAGISGDKIPVHGIRAIAGEINKGYMDPSEVPALFELTDSQTLEFQTFLLKMSVQTDKQAFSSMVFDWLALAELGIKPEVYRDEAQFWARMDVIL